MADHPRAAFVVGDPVPGDEVVAVEEASGAVAEDEDALLIYRVHMEMSIFSFLAPVPSKGANGPSCRAPRVVAPLGLAPNPPFSRVR